jgi:hypothetical protein
MSTVATPTAPHGRDSQLPSVLDKKGVINGRRSTPDSEALTSSDDEIDPATKMSLSLHSAKSMPVQKPMRRSSWLSDVHSSGQRKYSLGGGQPLASVSGSQPPTPSAENGSHIPNAQGLLLSSRVGGVIGAASSPSWDRDSAAAVSGPWGVNPTTGRPSTGHSSFNWNSPIWQQPKSTSRPSLPSPSASSTSTHLSAHPPPGSHGQHSPLQSASIQAVSQAQRKPSLTGSALSPTSFSPWGTSIPQDHSLQNVHSPSASSQGDFQSPSSSTFEQAMGAAASSLPFEIPLEPNRKTMRSQSYSSGTTRGPIVRRASRPSILSSIESVAGEPGYDEESVADFAAIEPGSARANRAGGEIGGSALDNEMAETALSAQSSAAFARSTLDAASQDHIRSQAGPSIFENRGDPGRLWNTYNIGNIPEEDHESSPLDTDPRYVIGKKPGEFSNMHGQESEEGISLHFIES